MSLSKGSKGTKRTKNTHNPTTKHQNKPKPPTKTKQIRLMSAQDVKKQKVHFFCTSTDAMWAVCPGHRCKERKHVMMMGNKTQENTQNAAKQTKNKQPNNHNQNKTKGQKADSPSKTTVFPLYGGETGENEDNIQSKGLNSLRKSAKCICARAKSLRSQSNVASF